MTKQVQYPDLGPLNPLLDDDDVREIIINRWDEVFVKRRAVFEQVPGVFENEAAVWSVVETLREIAAGLDRTINNRHPVANLRIGVTDKHTPLARVNIVLPPVSIFGPAITIWKFPRRPLAVEDLLRFGTWDERIVELLRGCVKAGCNIVVAGNVNAGKMTVFNILTGFIPPDERVVTVEHVLELQPSPTLKHVVRMESHPADHEGQGEVTIHDLVHNAEHMRPDRLLLGELRGSEALDALRAIHNGQHGTMFAVHATSVRDALVRLEAMCAMHPTAPSPVRIRQMLAESIDLITYQEQMRDGSRKILKIAEVTGIQGDTIAVQDIFEFRQTGVDAGRVEGLFWCETVPSRALMWRLGDAGIYLPPAVFDPP